MCGLGRGFGQIGAARARRRRAGARQSAALRRLGARDRACARLDVLATAAVRDASDGSEFAAEIERRYRRARAHPRRRGGGTATRPWACSRAFPTPTASSAISAAAASSWCRSPGAASALARPCRSARCALPAVADDDEAARGPIDKQHRPAVPGAPTSAANFYAVGGAWRALARIHMEQTRLSAPHHPVLYPGAPRRRELSRADRAPVAQIPGADRHDLEEAARGRAAGGARPAAPLEAHRAQASWCSRRLGLREGHLYSLLHAAEQRAGSADRRVPRRPSQSALRLMARSSSTGRARSSPRRRIRASACAAPRRALSATSPGPSIPIIAPSRRCASALYTPVANGITHETRFPRPGAACPLRRARQRRLRRRSRSSTRRR